MRVLLTGGRGMLGTAVREEIGASQADIELQVLTHAEVDLRDAHATNRAIKDASPDLIIHAAARVGGIAANMADPTGFLLDNLRLDSSLFQAALDNGVAGLVYVGSSCMYPKDYRQPLVETDVLAAPLEPTNEGYALAKISGARLCQYISEQHGLNYRAIIPSNLYGPFDDFSPGRAHLVAAAIAKTHAAKQAGDDTVEVWGDGTARREFTYVKDLSRWLVAALDALSSLPPLLNIGCGYDLSVREFYELAKQVVGFDGELRFDPTRPAGMQQKLMSSALAAEHGWVPKTSLADGMAETYSHYLEVHR